MYLALDNNLEILPVINKIDLPSADPQGVIREVEEVIGLPADHAPVSYTHLSHFFTHFR